MSSIAMSNETDLDWFARNVHVWPTETDFVFAGTGISHGNMGWYPADYCFSKSSLVTRQQWLARRAELQNKPGWGSVGIEINFISQHEDGQWIGHSEKPKEGGECFECNCIVSLFGYGEVLGDWRDTLEKRPADLSEQAVTARLKEATDNVLAAAPGLMTDKYKFEPFVSVEDAKITIMQSDGDVKHFGGIIGRSLPLEEDAATAKQPTPKGSGNPILGMVLADLTNRALEGKEKYGEPLLAHNGRNPLWDAYQEALDLAMYLRQAIEELG